MKIKLYVNCDHPNEPFIVGVGDDGGNIYMYRRDVSMKTFRPVYRVAYCHHGSLLECGRHVIPSVLLDMVDAEVSKCWINEI